MLSVLGKPGNAVHLADETEVLEKIALIDEDPVDAQLLEGDGVVLALAVGAFLELCLKAFFRFLQLLHDAAVVASLGPGFANGLFELVFLPVHEAREGFIRDGQLLKRLCDTITAS